jgi:hypothetical protein
MSNQDFPIDDYLNVDAELSLIMFPQASGISKEEATKIIDKLNLFVLGLNPCQNVFVKRDQIVKYTCARIGAIILNQLKLYSGWKHPLGPNSDDLQFGYTTIWIDLVKELTNPIYRFEESHCFEGKTMCQNPKCEHSIFISDNYKRTKSYILWDAVNLWNQSNDKSKYHICAEEVANWDRFELKIRMDLNSAIDH